MWNTVCPAYKDRGFDHQGPYKRDALYYDQEDIQDAKNLPHQQQHKDKYSLPEMMTL